MAKAPAKLVDIRGVVRALFDAAKTFERREHYRKWLARLEKAALETAAVAAGNRGY